MINNWISQTRIVKWQKILSSAMYSIISFSSMHAVVNIQIALWCAQEAVSKYEVVIQNLDFARELHKQFLQISADVCISAF